MLERLRASDYRFLAICLTLLAVTVWFSLNHFHQAFPEASIDFKVNREEARAIGEKFLTARGYKLGEYRQAAQFTFQNEAKTFLEREAGLEQANRIMGSRVRLWRWANRWFRPQQKEEFRAEVTPRGEVVEFEHQIPEAAARPSIPADQARAAAEEFLRTVMRRDPAALDFVEGASQARPARTDHTFTWKERDFSFKDSTNRLEVTLLGNEVGGYREYLKVPEQWQRDFERLRSKNQAAQMGDTALMMVLIIGLLASLAVCVRRREVAWRRASVVGMIGGGLFFLSSWNEFPLTEFNFSTTDSYASFVARQALNSVLGALASGGLLFVLTAAAEPLYREAYGGRISLGNLFRLRALRTRSFFLGTVLGIALTGIFIAYQIAFYLLAFRFGAWSPADVPYSDLLNTKFPWAFVLLGGFLPAVSEEFLFRMFAIPYLKKLVRFTWVAVVLAGFLWGFGHAGYPQQPFYIRGVEVGIGGVALGLIMLRWGILPTLVWHYSVDAVYSAMLLVRSESLYFKLSGAAGAGIMLLPAVLALVAYLRYGGFEPEAGLTNSAEVPEAEEPEDAKAEAEAAAPPQAITLPYVSWSTTRRVAALAIFAVGMAALLIPVDRLGDAPRYSLTPGKARAAAEAFLRELKADPATFRTVVYPATHWDGPDGEARKYFLERKPVSWVQSMLERGRPPQYWRLRYFRTLDKEEFEVSVHPETGRILGFSHSIPEDRTGGDVSPEAARGIAVEFAQAHGWDLLPMELKESSSEKRKARRDHTLVWEAATGDDRNLADARYRVRAEVAGSEIKSLYGFWHIPETYSRARSQQNALSIFVSIVKIGVISGAIVIGLLALILRTRRGQVRWRDAIRIALPLTVLAAISAGLTYHLTWKGYNTAIPAATFQAMMITGLVISLIFIFLALCGAAAFVRAVVPECGSAFSAAVRRATGADATIAMLLAFGLVALVAALRGLLLAKFHTAALFGLSAPDLIVSAAPAISGLSAATRSTLTYAAVLALVALLAEHLRPRWLVFPVALLALVATVPGDARTVSEFALHYAAGAITLAASAVFCMGFARRNYLAYGLTAWALAIRTPAVELIGQPIGLLQVQGALIVIILGISIGWVLLPVFDRRPTLQ
jgi:membrane protease YdiL (CAAX protease family)